MIRKYRAIYHSGTIATVDVIRETSKSVFLESTLWGELRRGKVTEHESYHDSFEEAREALRVHLTSDLSHAERKVKIIKDKLLALDEQEDDR